LVGLDVLVRQVAHLTIDKEQAFLIRHIKLHEFGLQNIGREVHVSSRRSPGDGLSVPRG
jgi:hypothetical protein